MPLQILGMSHIGRISFLIFQRPTSQTAVFPSSWMVVFHCISLPDHYHKKPLQLSIHVQKEPRHVPPYNLRGTNLLLIGYGSISESYHPRLICTHIQVCGLGFWSRISLIWIRPIYNPNYPTYVIPKYQCLTSRIKTPNPSNVMSTLNHSKCHIRLKWLDTTTKVSKLLFA